MVLHVSEPLISTGIRKLASHKTSIFVACEIYITLKTTQLMFLNTLTLPEWFSVLDNSTVMSTFLC